MKNLSSLEREVLRKLACELSVSEKKIDFLKIKSRDFSTADGIFCSGFYLSFEVNNFFEGVGLERRVYTLQARSDKLKYKEIGFNIFCDPEKKSLDMLEGYTYGEEILAVEEFLKERHDFFVFATEGL